MTLAIEQDPSVRQIQDLFFLSENKLCDIETTKLQKLIYASTVY